MEANCIWIMTQKSLYYPYKTLYFKVENSTAVILEAHQNTQFHNQKKIEYIYMRRAYFRVIQAKVNKSKMNT